MIRTGWLSESIPGFSFATSAVSQVISGSAMIENTILPRDRNCPLLEARTIPLILVIGQVAHKAH